MHIGGAFAINSSTGQITVNKQSALDFEANPSFNLTVEVTDSGTPSLTDTVTITISLNDLNEVPTVNDQGFSPDENSANGTVVGTVVTGDPVTPDYSGIQYLLSEQDSSLTADYPDSRYSLGEIVLPKISLPEAYPS